MENLPPSSLRRRIARAITKPGPGERAASRPEWILGPTSTERRRLAAGSLEPGQDQPVPTSPSCPALRRVAAESTVAALVLETAPTACADRYAADVRGRWPVALEDAPHRRSVQNETAYRDTGRALGQRVRRQVSHQPFDGSWRNGSPAGCIARHLVARARRRGRRRANRSARRVDTRREDPAPHPADALRLGRSSSTGLQRVGWGPWV